MISLTKDKISSDDSSNINSIYHINLIDQKKISIGTFDPELKEQCTKMVEEKERGLHSWLQNIVKLTRDYLNSNSVMKVILTNLDLRNFHSSKLTKTTWFELPKTNVWCNETQSKHRSISLLCLLWFSLHQTLLQNRNI